MESKDGVIVTRPSAAELESMGLETWNEWTCPVSEFDWTYSDTEEAYVLEGSVEVTGPRDSVQVNAGDFVRFPKDFSCHWKVTSPIRKVYRFL